MVSDWPTLDCLDQVRSLISGVAHAGANPMKSNGVVGVRQKQFHGLTGVGEIPVQPLLGPIWG